MLVLIKMRALQQKLDFAFVLIKIPMHHLKSAEIMWERFRNASEAPEFKLARLHGST